MNLLLLPMLFVGMLLFLPAKNVRAASFPWGSGFYINLYGGGADPNGNIGDYNGEAACNIATGTCIAQNRLNGQFYESGNVQRYICRGKVLNCDNTFAASGLISGPEYGKTLDMTNPGCDRTVQLDVFDKNMGGTLKGYMTWYSGDCSAVRAAVVPTPTPTTTPTYVAPTPSPTPQPLTQLRRLPPTGMGAVGWLALGLVPLGFLAMRIKKK